MSELNTVELPVYDDEPTVSAAVTQMNRAVLVTLTIGDQQAKFWCFSKGHDDSPDMAGLTDRLMVALRDATRIDEAA